MSENKSEDNEFELYTAKGCPSCASAKKVYAPLIESGRVKVLDVSTDKEAFDKLLELTMENKEKRIGVPIMKVKNKVTGSEELCELGMDGKVLYCKDREVKL